jgi:hypothetical protein
VIIGDFQRFQTFHKTSLKVSTTGCFDCCVNQPAKNSQNFNIVNIKNIYCRNIQNFTYIVLISIVGKRSVGRGREERDRPWPAEKEAAGGGALPGS